MKKGYKPKGKLGSGVRFGSMTQQIKSEYLKKGYDSEKAEEIGAATAAKAGKKKFGKTNFQGLAKK